MNERPTLPSEDFQYQPAYTRQLITLSGEDLLQKEFPPRDLILAPWLPVQGLAMVYAERGIGKTWVAMNIAYAVASGRSFLKWSALRPRRVVYIDGEMPGSTLKERYASIAGAVGPELVGDAFQLISADLQPDGLPDLASPDAQRYYASALEGADLVIIDNLSTIARSVRENEADSWGPMQGWMLSQRAAGRSVLLIHHAGKSGQQRGSSRKEDVLDTVISLRRPPNYEPSEGARFEVHFTKQRGFFGPEAEPFEARLVDNQWLTGDIFRDDSGASLKAMQVQGLSVRQIAERTGISKSTVSRKLNGSDFGPS